MFESIMTLQQLLVYTTIFFCSCTWLASCQNISDHYAVVLDAGSTGSRAFVFTISVGPNGKQQASSETCGKVRPGLSEFASNHTGVHAYLIPVLEDCKGLVPQHLQSQTQLYIKGTAGMRILDDDIRSPLWDTVVAALQGDTNIPFQVSRRNCGTISGHMEAFYAVVASNYIAGTIDANLISIGGESMIGAMDMGGGSNQLVIHNIDPTASSSSSSHSKVEAEHFWSHSFLHYGVNRIRERVMQYLYAQHIQYHAHSKEPLPTMMYFAGANYNRSYNVDTVATQPSLPSTTMAGVGAAATAGAESAADGSSAMPEPTTSSVGRLVNTIVNPCALRNTQDVFEDDDQWVFLGSSNPAECLRIIEEVMWPTTRDGNNSQGQELTSVVVDVDGSVITDTGCTSYPCPVDSIVHPAVDGHHFFAMSVYYYALDCIRQIGPAPIAHWPNPTIAELKDAATEYCQLEWAHARQKFFDIGKHPYTRKYQLPHRCLESLYIVTLLEKGFGFDRDSRSITLALEVEGKEVEWTLGFVLAELDFPTPAPAPSLHTDADNCAINSSPAASSTQATTVPTPKSASGSASSASTSDFDYNILISEATASISTGCSAIINSAFVVPLQMVKDYLPAAVSNVRQSLAKLWSSKQ